ncbi:hypothetical protein T10_5231 [Trichinella papuae]|uniref:Uncharacterized protein n=1 Tax=Trichinella papuae TaxID=268474 RepID=A0A0V1MR87_9BILA|nr:hypothetical protein T10_5231 [Trichinella papuae]
MLFVKDLGNPSCAKNNLHLSNFPPISSTGELCALVPYWRTFIGEDNIAGLICPEDGDVGERPMLGLRPDKPPICERLVPVINATGLPRGEPQPWVCVGNFGQLFSG